MKKGVARDKTPDHEGPLLSWVWLFYFIRDMALLKGFKIGRND